MSWHVSVQLQGIRRVGGNLSISHDCFWQRSTQARNTRTAKKLNIKQTNNKILLEVRKTCTPKATPVNEYKDMAGNIFILFFSQCARACMRVCESTHVFVYIRKISYSMSTHVFVYIRKISYSMSRSLAKTKRKIHHQRRSHQVIKYTAWTALLALRVRWRPAEPVKTNTCNCTVVDTEVSKPDLIGLSLLCCHVRLSTLVYMFFCLLAF